MVPTPLKLADLEDEVVKEQVKADLNISVEKKAEKVWLDELKKQNSAVTDLMVG